MAKKKEDTIKRVLSVDEIRAVWERFLNRWFLLSNYPFYAEMAIKANVHFNPARDTACMWITPGKFHIEVGSNWATWDDKTQEFAVIHEIEHFTRCHIPRFNKLSHDKGNIACDLEINQNIPNPPGWELQPDKYDLPPEKTAEWYYGNIPQDDDGGGTGSGCGEPSPDGQSGDQHSDDHEGWGNSTNVDDGAAEQTVKDYVKDALDRMEKSKTRGNVPAHLEEVIKKLLEPPKINWKRQFAGYVATHLAQSPAYSWASPHYRTDLKLPGKRATHEPSVIFILDTSGSMSTECLNKALVELDGVLKATGATCHFIEADAAVNQVQKYESHRRKHQVASFKGRGGTDFRPACAYIVEKHLDPDVVIYFTDGEGTYPEIKPKFPIIWLLFEGNPKKIPYGRVVIYDPAQ
jgi:predicted metal-dependent peptidase